MNDPVRAFVLDTDGTVAAQLEAALAEAQGAGVPTLQRVESLEALVDEAAAAADPVLLLPLPEAGRDGILPVVEVLAASPGIPLVVLAESRSEPLAIKAVQLGATDYLLLDRLYGTLLVRCLRHAVEVERIRARLAEQELPASLSPDGGSAAHVASLRESLPRRFDELVEGYGRLLDRAVEQILYRVEHDVEKECARLARRAGRVGAGPRDAVEIHATAMKLKERETGPQRLRLYSAEGSVRLLELMGHLVSYYRRLGLGRGPRSLFTGEEGGGEA